MTQFFSLGAPKEKMSHFDLKSWVTGWTKIWPNFLRQNDSIFCSVHREKKLSHFDLKSWVTWRNYNSINFHNRSTEPLNYRIYARPQSFKQAGRPEFYKYIILLVTRCVKLSLNFELLVNRVMKFSITFFVQLELLRIQETTMIQNKIK